MLLSLFKVFLFHIPFTFGWIPPMEQLSSSDIQFCINQFLFPKLILHPDIGLRADQIIQKHGYPVEVFRVTSEDGYILLLYRIPFSPYSRQFRGRKKKPVILNHGIAGRADRWLLQPGNKNLAFRLADAGLDVFLSNGRGSTHSQMHVNLTADNDAYWNFSYHEQAIYDIPAIVEKIISITRMSHVYYVGYSSGTAQYFIAMSQLPALNTKIATAFLISPVAFMGHMTNTLRHAVPYYGQIKNILEKLWGNKLTLRANLARALGMPAEKLCFSNIWSCQLCLQTSYLVHGRSHPSQMNYTTLSLFMSSYPEAVSTKTVAHFAQLIKTGEFRQFDYDDPETNKLHYGVRKPPVYNITSITAPTTFIYSSGDDLTVPQDVMITASHMNNRALRAIHHVPFPFFTHGDMILGNDADIFVYDFIKSAILNDTFSDIR